MSKIAVELEPIQLEKALTHLDDAERFRLAKILAARSFSEVISKLRRTARHGAVGARDSSHRRAGAAGISRSTSSLIRTVYLLSLKLVYLEGKLYVSINYCR